MAGEGGEVEGGGGGRGRGYVAEGGGVRDNAKQGFKAAAAP